MSVLKRSASDSRKLILTYSGKLEGEHIFLLNPILGSYIILFVFIFQLTQWYRDDWWNAANIIATDFFLGNNLIEESIIANRRRNACRRQARFSW